MMHPLNPIFLTQEAVAEVARAAETAGFEAVAVTEHPIPFDPWLEGGGHDALDPFVALSFAAAATTRLKLLTNLTVVPYRNPFMLAKAAATLDRLSNGRLILGCGTGYLKEEFDAIGVDFEERNALFDESLEVLRKTWKAESVTHRGLHFEAPGNTANPAPAQSPIPIWIGGNSKLSRRRAAEKAEGWMPIPNPRALGSRRRTVHVDDLDDLREILSYMLDHARSIGRRDPIDVFFPALGGASAEGIDAAIHTAYLDELAEIGVNWALAPVGGSNLEAIVDAIAWYGREVIDRTT
ncbi:MAG: LLM class F420-dependent oxidoreductase [bacterium]|nr:LLM class F420-dependent oxidoreductase [Deltaproteobacteria bacterium]MCP4904310.1 LLM class F420-dependent oxidoreductase [bacterium]